MTPICTCLTPTWPLHECIAYRTMPKHRREWGATWSEPYAYIAHHSDRLTLTPPIFDIIFGSYCRTPPPSIRSGSLMAQFRTNYCSDGLTGREITIQPASSAALNFVQMWSSIEVYGSSGRRGQQDSCCRDLIRFGTRQQQQQQQRRSLISTRSLQQLSKYSARPVILLKFQFANIAFEV